MKNDRQIGRFRFNYSEPIICTAIHNGHLLDPILVDNIALSDFDLLYEEDPHTSFFTEVAENQIIINYSRFQTDLNRPLEGSFYEKPEQAWGLKVRKHPVSEIERQISQEGYKWFYQEVKFQLAQLLDRFGQVFVFDLHSYNHQRGGPNAEYDDPAANPEIIIGTSNLPEHWMPLVNEIVAEMREQDFFGRKLDIRKNVKFPGGHFPRWLNSSFDGRVGSIAVEFKKIFMNEWTGEVNWEKARRLRDILSCGLDVIRNRKTLY